MPVCISLSIDTQVFFIVAEGPYMDVVKLQTMRCLFEAYEHVLSLLENVFTPMFCHSDEVRVKDSKSSLKSKIVFFQDTLFTIVVCVELKNMASFPTSVGILELDHSQQENRIYSSTTQHHRTKEKLHFLM